MYNHANPANVRYKASDDGSLLILIADTRIEQDEELTINYNFTVGETRSSEDNWFKDSGITPYVSNSSTQRGG